MWEEFNEQRNSEETLAAKAVRLSPILVHISEILARETVDEAISLGRATAKTSTRANAIWDLLLETCAFYIQLMDRLAFGVLGPLRRNDFLDPLLVEVLEILVDIGPSTSEAVQRRRELLWMVNDRQTEYSQYRLLYLNPNEGFGSTLFWEFSSKLAGIIDRTKDGRVVVPVMVKTVTSIDSYELTDLLIRGENLTKSEEESLKVNTQYVIDLIGVYLDNLDESD